MDLSSIGKLKLTSVYSYRICLLLTDSKPKTLTMLSNILATKTQYISNPIKELVENDIIEVDRIEGSNKFYKLKK